jgi:acyl-CoA dehydrogenase
MSCVEGVSDTRLVNIVRGALDHAARWLADAKGEALEAGARRFSLTLGRTIELALLIKHAQWSLDRRTIESAQRFASLGVDLIF